MRKLTILPLLFFAIQILAQSKENGRFELVFFAGLETQSLGVEFLGKWPYEPTAWSGRSNEGVSVGFFAQKSLWRWLHFQQEQTLATPTCFCLFAWHKQSSFFG